MLKMDKDRWAAIKTSSKSTLDKSWTTGKKGFDKGWKALDKLGAPVNRLSNKLGSEAFWPMTLDKESEKAARILKTFIGGEEQDELTEPTEGVPQGRQRVAKRIPPSVIANAKAIAVFTACRTGFWVSSAGGAGVLIKRLQSSERFESISIHDDSPPSYTETLTPPRTPDAYKSQHWSPPSGILLHTAALGFLAGADIYDCVMVLNTDAAVEAFTNPRITLGAEVSVAAGPYSLGGVLDQNIGGGVRHLNEMRKRRGAAKGEEKEEQSEDVVEISNTPQKSSTWNKIKDERPVWSYLKSRGLYFGLGQLDGSIVIERTDENARFYNSEGIKVKQILAGDVIVPSPTTEEGGVHALWETLDAVVEASSGEQAMSGIVARARKVFVRPKIIAPIDDDPFGVRALEKSGIQLVEAGTHRRINSEEFDRIFPPSPNTPTSLRERSRSRSRSPSPPALPKRSESLRLPTPPPLPKRSESLRTAKPGRWSAHEADVSPTTMEDKETLEEEFENVPLRNEEAIKRAEKEIKEWEKQAEEREQKEREARTARMKRLSHDGILERIPSNDTIFDFASASKEREKRRSTYHM